MVFTTFFTILPLILMLFPQKNGLKNHCFCNVLQLVSLYYKVGGVCTDTWLETMVSAMFCSYFHLILTLMWKNLHGLAKNHQKHMGFSSISPYFDLILTLIEPYFEVIFGNLGICKKQWFFTTFFTILPLILMLFPQKTAQNHCFCNVVAAGFTLFWPWFWKNLHGLAKNHQKHMGFFID